VYLYVDLDKLVQKAGSDITWLVLPRDLEPSAMAWKLLEQQQSDG
jgi:hypothetical protein